MLRALRLNPVTSIHEIFPAKRILSRFLSPAQILLPYMPDKELGLWEIAMVLSATMGHNVHEAGDLQEALAKARKTKPDMLEGLAKFVHESFHHADIQAQWKNWLKQPEGIRAMERRAGKRR